MKTLPLFLISAFVIVVAGLAMTAQLVNRFIVLINWGGQVGMSYPTAVCFILTGIAIGMIAWEIEKR